MANTEPGSERYGDKPIKGKRDRRQPLIYTQPSTRLHTQMGFTRVERGRRVSPHTNSYTGTRLRTDAAYVCVHMTNSISFNSISPGAAQLSFAPQSKTRLLVQARAATSDPACAHGLLSQQHKSATPSCPNAHSPN